MSELWGKFNELGYRAAGNLYQCMRQNPQLASRDLHREVIVSPRWLAVNRAINTVRGADTQFDHDGYVYEYDYYQNLVGYKLELFDYYLGELNQRRRSDVNTAVKARRRAIHDDLLGNTHELARASRASGGYGNFENFMALFAREVTRCANPTSIDEGIFADQLSFGMRYVQPDNYWGGDSIITRMRNRMVKAYDALLLFRDRFEYREFVSHVVEEMSIPLFDGHQDFWGAALHLERQVFGLTGYAMHEPLTTAAGNVIAQGRFFDHMPEQDEIDAQIAAGEKGAPYDEYDEG